jgi:hypothetical protein
VRFRHLREEQTTAGVATETGLLRPAYYTWNAAMARGFRSWGTRSAGGPHAHRRAAPLWPSDAPRWLGCAARMGDVPLNQSKGLCDISRRPPRRVGSGNCCAVTEKVSPCLR